MENNKISKYNKALIEGLGCEVSVSVNNNNGYIQGVNGIKDKKTNQWLRSDTYRTADWNEADRFIDLKGVKETKYIFSNGGLIFLREYGDIVIRLNPNINIKANYDRQNIGNSEIMIYKDDVLLMKIRYKSCLENSSRWPRIEVLSPKDLCISYIDIVPDGTSWMGSQNYYEFEKYSIDKVVSILKRNIKSYAKENGCESVVNICLPVFIPVFRVYALEFMKEWVSAIKNTIKILQISQTEMKHVVAEYQKDIVMDGLYVEILKGIHKELNISYSNTEKKLNSK